MTSTLEPRRTRVVVAELLAVVVLGLAAVAVALLLAAVGHQLGRGDRGLLRHPRDGRGRVGPSSAWTRRAKRSS